MSNYEFKHLKFLLERIKKGDILSNEDCIFLTDMRTELREANEQLLCIDEILNEEMINC